MEDNLVSPFVQNWQSRGPLQYNISIDTTFDTFMKPQIALGHLDMYESDVDANQF